MPTKKVTTAPSALNERELLCPDLDPEIRFEAAPACTALADDSVAVAVGMALLTGGRPQNAEMPMRDERPWAMLARTENLRYR